MNVKWLISSLVLSWICWSKSASNTCKTGHRQPDWQRNLSASREKVGRKPRRGSLPLRQSRRSIDHLNLMAAAAGAVRDFIVDILGFCERERVDGGDGSTQTVVGG